MSAHEPTQQLRLDIPCCSRKSLKQISSRLLLEYFQLLLYQRSQIPEPFQLIQRRLQSENTGASSLQQSMKQAHAKRSEVQYMKKCVQLQKSLEEIKSCIFNVVDKCNSVEAVIVLGATPVTVKEAFRFNAVNNGIFSTEGLCDASTLNCHTRKLCMLMVQSSLTCADDLPLTNSRILIKTTKSDVDRRSRQWPNFRFPSKKEKLTVELNLCGSVSQTSNLNDCYIRSASQLHISDSRRKSKKKHAISARHSWPCSAYSHQRYHKQQEFNKENIQPATSDMNVHDNAQKHTTTLKRLRRLSVTDVLKAVFAEQDNDNFTEEQGRKSTLCDDSSSTSTTSEESLWFELPVVIKGFKF